MNSILSRNVVELLDRKYSFVDSSSPEEFLLDLEHFIEFILEDESIKPFTQKVWRDLLDRSAQYDRRLAEEQQLAIEIKTGLSERYPEMDDSAMDRPPARTDTDGYRYSFAEFNNIINGNAGDWGIPLLPLGEYYDAGDVAKLIEILAIKVVSCERIVEVEESSETRTVDHEIKARLDFLKSRHSYTHRAWKNFQRVSPGRAIWELATIVGKINPEPEAPTQETAVNSFEQFWKSWKKRSTSPDYSWVSTAVYGNALRRPDGVIDFQMSKQMEAVFARTRGDLKRVYEVIREEIGTTLLHQQLIERYKLRCQWYNQDYLRKQVMKEDGSGYEKNREDWLTKDLALYLFDQGVTTLYRVRYGKHELDLIEIEAPSPIAVEAKAYIDHTAKRDLVSGIAQFHSYLCGLEGHKDVSEAYYVIFRLGGPIYEFRRKITTNRFVIYPILVDIGLSKDSGRKQPKPILISQEEIFAEISAGKQT